MKIDYHTHTEMSLYNKQTIDQLCETAVSKGIEELCITEHIDFNPKDTCYGGFNWDKLVVNSLYAKEKYGLTVKLGAEFDAQYIYQDKINFTIQQCDFDYIMGSCHYCHNKVLFNHPEFFEGKTQKQAYTEYFLEELDTIKKGVYDGVSHFDLIKRTGGGVFGSYNPEDYKDIIAQCMEEIIKRDMTIELNSSGLRHTCKEIYPHPWILKLYKDLGGENVTYGSDGHSPAQDGYALEESYEILKSLGFKYLVTYNKRKKIYVEY